MLSGAATERPTRVWAPLALSLSACGGFTAGLLQQVPMVEFAAGGPLLQDGQRHGARHPPFVARHPPVSCKEAPNPRPWSSAGIWQQLELWMRSGCLVLVKGNRDRSKASQYFSGEEAESRDGFF